MEKRNHWIKIFSLFLAMTILLCADVSIGSVSFSFLDIVKNIFGADDSLISTILWQFRLTKAITCILAGAALACSGLLMQTLFRNPLAGPDVLGLSSGASLAVGMLLLLGRNFQFAASEWTLALAAGIGGAGILFMMLAVSKIVRDNASLLIIGLMLAAATSSIMSVMQYVSRAEDLQLYVLWTMGNVGNASWKEIGVLTIILVFGIAVSIFLVKPLNSWLLGENYARSLGTNVDRARTWIVITTGIMTGAITAFCGPIAFVGLAVPHLARLILPTTNHKLLIPAVVFMGAILLLFCDVIAQLASHTQSLPLNALTSLIGAPVVIWQVMKFKKISV
ncbi:MAG: iron ABC transporter permease [Cyclobacteriaceae bacterium]